LNDSVSAISPRRGARKTGGKATRRTKRGKTAR
jgi:hypothetical protein